MASNTKYQNLFEFCVKGDRIGLADYIITNSCNPSAYDARDTNGRTALHIACQHGHLFTVRSLIEVFGCSPTIVDKSGNLPLHVACLHGHLPIVDFLFSFVANKGSATAVFLTDSEGNNLLHKACQSGSVATVRYILQIVSYPKEDLTNKKLNLYQDSVTVYDAASIEKPSFCHVQSLILCITRQNTLGDTAIHVACRHGHLKVLKVFQAYFPYKVLKSILIIAVQCNQVRIVNYLRAVKNVTVLDFNSEVPGKRKPTKIAILQKFQVIRITPGNIMMYVQNKGEQLMATCEDCHHSFTVLNIPNFTTSTSTGHCPFCNKLGDGEQPELRYSFQCESCSSVFTSDKAVKVNCSTCKSSKLTFLIQIPRDTFSSVITYRLHPRDPQEPS